MAIEKTYGDIHHTSPPCQYRSKSSSMDVAKEWFHPPRNIETRCIWETTTYSLQSIMNRCTRKSVEAPSPWVPMNIIKDCWVALEQMDLLYTSLPHPSDDAECLIPHPLLELPPLKYTSRRYLPTFHDDARGSIEPSRRKSKSHCTCTTTPQYNIEDAKQWPRLPTARPTLKTIRTSPDSPTIKERIVPSSNVRPSNKTHKRPRTSMGTTLDVYVDAEEASDATDIQILPMSSHEAHVVASDVRTTMCTSKRSSFQLVSISKIKQPEQEKHFNEFIMTEPMYSVVSLYASAFTSTDIISTDYRLRCRKQHSEKGSWRDKCGLENRNNEDMIELYSHISSALQTGRCDRDGFVRILILRAAVPKYSNDGFAMRRYGCGNRYPGILHNQVYVNYELKLKKL